MRTTSRLSGVWKHNRKAKRKTKGISAREGDQDGTRLHKAQNKGCLLRPSSAKELLPPPRQALPWFSHAATCSLCSLSRMADILEFLPMKCPHAFQVRAVFSRGLEPGLNGRLISFPSDANHQRCLQTRVKKVKRIVATTV